MAMKMKISAILVVWEELSISFMVYKFHVEELYLFPQLGK